MNGTILLSVKFGNECTLQNSSSSHVAAFTHDIQVAATVSKPCIITAPNFLASNTTSTFTTTTTLLFLHTTNQPQMIIPHLPRVS